MQQRLALSTGAALLLLSRLPAVTRDAQRLPVRHVIPCTTLANWHDMVSLSHSLGDPPAVLTLPRITGKHGLTPFPVCH